VAAVAAAVAATLIVADIGLTIAGQMAAVPPINRPAVATGPEPPSAPIQSAISSSYQGLPLPGNEADAFVTASNDVIGALNVIDDDILMGQPGGVVDDFLAFTDTLGPVADEYQNIFGAQEPFIPQLNLSQPDIDALQADIAQSGLPPEFVTTLLDAGFSPSTIQGFTTFIGSTEINLGVPTVTGSQIFDAAADITFVPEPASLLLLGTGVGLLGVRRRKRPRPALQSINSDARTC
jgi:hypothetical protein